MLECPSCKAAIAEIHIGDFVNGYPKKWKAERRCANCEYVEQFILRRVIRYDDYGALRMYTTRRLVAEAISSEQAA